MPHVSFSARDLKRGVVVTPAWYRVKIEAVGEQPSADGGSTNYPVEGTIICNADDGSKDFAEVPITWNFNSKAMGFSRGFLEAQGVQVLPDTRYELAASEGKVIEVFIDNKTYNNRILNNVNHQYRAARG
jgi:hypothetical protein